MAPSSWRCYRHKAGCCFDQCPLNPQGTVNFGECRLLGLADLNSADAEQAATLTRRFGGSLADLTKPAFESRSIRRGLRLQHRRNLAKSFNRLRLEVCRLAVGELGLQAVARGASRFARRKIRRECL